MEHTSLSAAVERHVVSGDVVHLGLGHSRWTAAARELVRQTWGTDPGFTLVMLSLSSLGALFFRGGLVRKVITAYSGDSFPTYTPNPIFQQAYSSGAVEVEHWSILTFAQRLYCGPVVLPRFDLDQRNICPQPEPIGPWHCWLVLRTIHTNATPMHVTCPASRAGPAAASSAN